MAEARRIEKKLKAQVKQEIFLRENAGATWKELVKEWANELQKGRATSRPISVNTTNDYVYLVETYTKDWRKRFADDIQKADLKEVFEVVKKQLSKSSVNRMRSALNCIFGWAIDTRRVKNMPDSPAKGITIDYKKREKKPEVYSIVEQRQLLDAAQNLNHHWYPVWAVALSTGMRNGELYALR